MLQKSQWRVALVFLLFAALIFFWGRAFNLQGTPPSQSISYTQFINAVDAGNVNSVTISGQTVTGEFKKEEKIHVPETNEEVPVRDFTTMLPTFQGEGLLNTLEAKGVAINVKSAQSSFLWQVIIGVLPWALIIGFWVIMMKRAQQMQGPGGVFSFGSSRAKLFDAKKPGVTFKDVAGMEHAKQDLRETIEFLKEPSRFRRLGAKVPKGVLLIGPPGTGKTLLARATAGEAGVSFFSISASEFIEMFVGVGASRVRDMFKKAREAQPSIIFMDEIDAVGRTRGTGLGGGHDEREQTLNQLLSEMDGFEPHEEVIVMAATNRPDVLDPALLRPGRFDRRIIVDRPGWKERLAILQVHTRDKALAPDVNLETLAKATPGMSGADLENLANEAALTAIRKNEDVILMADFEEAMDKVLMGAPREDSLTGMERKITAYHESGHAIVASVLPGTDPVHKVSILPRGMALGVTQMLPEEDRHYYPRTYLVNRVSVMLGGRAAEKLVFGEVSSGAQNDLKDGTSIAEKMVAQWGMSEKLGPLNLGRGEEHPFLGRELAQPKHYSEEMAWMMDREIQAIMKDAEASAEGILSANRDLLDSLADALLKEEVLDKAGVDKIIAETREKRKQTAPAVKD